jgi:succinate dehydrogenase / fumarate reductase cytochrome b subunit
VICATGKEWIGIPSAVVRYGGADLAAAMPLRKSSIGSKILMALTGAVLLLWITGHMLGNLQIYAGQDALNAYAEKLRAIPALLYLVRVVMVVVVLIHIITSVTLWLQNRRARSLPYAYKDTVQASIGSRTMIYSGLLIFIFVIYHLMHLTWGMIHPEYAHLMDPKGRPDVYSMVVLGFQNAVISITYIIAMLCLWFHLSHGFSSLFQTLGLTGPKYRPLIERAGPIVATVIVAANISIPLTVLLGLIKPAVGGLP